MGDTFRESTSTDGFKAMSQQPQPQEVTQLLRASVQGNASATAKLLELTYNALRGEAVRLFEDERKSHTLQPTALVHESFLRLVGQQDIEWQSRGHFVGVAATMMRRILTDYARSRKSQKRGGGWKKLAEMDERRLSLSSDDDVLSIHEALEKLEQVDPRQAKIVELRFFGGMTNQEAADALGVSLRTVEADWSFAKAWLRRELSE